MALFEDRVVLAEDDPEISSMVKHYFERAYDLSVSITDRVDEIIPLVLRTKASVLIMDLELQDGDASQVVSDAADIEGLTVVILTGTWKGRAENKLLKDGAKVVMRKPQKASTIWQQVLNLRGANHPNVIKPPKFNNKIVWQGGSYDIDEGILFEEGGKKTYLSDRKRELMDILAGCLVDDLRAGIDIEGGWISTKDILRELFGSVEITRDMESSFWYYLRELKKNLECCAGEGSNLEPIENRRSGRSVSYYRLNPAVFSLDQEEKGA